MRHGIGRLAGAAGIAVLGVGALALFSLRPPALGLRAFPQAKWGPAYIHNAKDCDGQPVRLLRVGKSVQSATYLDGASYTEPVFDYILAFDMVFDAGLPVKDVLMVGGGGCAWPKHVIATRPDVRIDVLEADPVIVDVARRYFFVDELERDLNLAGTGRLNLICAEGESFLCNGSSARYDVIVMDAFQAGEPDAGLARAHVVRVAHERLSPQGVLMANVVSTLAGPGSAFLHAYLGTLRAEFRHVFVVPLSCDPDDTPDNIIVLATDGPWDFGGMGKWEGIKRPTF